MTQFLDCTLRDGGYYNAWDFPADLVSDYLVAMQAAGVDLVELGFRFLKNEGFKGAHAFTTDDYLRTLPIPGGLTVGVMVNGADLCTDLGREAALERLFPNSAEDSPVDLVRLACHYRELEIAFQAVEWLHSRGYRVGINLMQISESTEDELHNFARMASATPVEVLYFADSMGGMTPKNIAAVIQCLRAQWEGPIGVHTHDNLGLALSNTLKAADEGATWLDATVTGIGRGPGNARTEELAIELGERRDEPSNLVPLTRLIFRYFAPLRVRYGWGTNFYYYLAGKYGIHPTYVQNMLSDERFDPEDMLSVIDHLKEAGARQYSADRLEFARHFYPSEPSGSWDPVEEFLGRDVLILGAGPSARAYRNGVSAFIGARRPLVIALNTQQPVDESLIDYRAACHPIRLLADVEDHRRLGSPLITPRAMLPAPVARALEQKETRDYGLQIVADRFVPKASYAVIPSSLVIAYALAVAARGHAGRIFLAGFDGYGPGDSRTREVETILSVYEQATGVPPLISLTPTEYPVRTRSLFSPVLD